MPLHDSQAGARVVFALVGDVRRSSRALRQLVWLSKAGYQSTVICFGTGSSHDLGIEGVDLRLLERPAGSGPRFFLEAHRAIRAVALEIEADLYHASDLYTLPAMVAASRRHRGVVVYDARELYPHVDATSGKPWSRVFWSSLERSYIKRASAILTVNDSIADRMADAYRIERPLVLYNVPDPQPVVDGRSLRDRVRARADEVLVLYQGLIREGRGLRSLVTAMTRVPEATLVIIGDGPLRHEISRLAADHLGARAHVLPFIPPDELAALTPSADVGVCFLEPISESVRLALPNKLFEYLQAHLPVVASDLPEISRVVNGFDVGLTVPSDDPGLLARAIRRAAQDETARTRWRQNIPKVFQRYNVRDGRELFLQTYANLLD